jgi:CelD/BcsL family acetyltransferase involved in cellulose biosynthesis
MLLMASKSEKTIGCMLLLKFGKRVSAEFAVYDSDYVSISPLHRMFWEAIQGAHREGFMIFDFGRTSPDNVSLMDFKSRWGTEVMDLHRLHYPSSRADAINECHSALHRTVLRKLCKIAPRPVFVGIGDMIYNHMS